MSRFSRRVQWLVLGFLLMIPVSIYACAVAASTGGQIIGEPLGLDDIDIIHESLDIDLSEAYSTKEAKMEIVYQIYNPFEKKKLDLVFPLGIRGVKDFQLTLDDYPVAVSPSELECSDTSKWKSPTQTPPLYDQYPHYFSPSLGKSSSNLSAAAFHMMLEPGNHTIRVKYHAACGTPQITNHPLAASQFAYLFQSARDRKHFSGMDLQIHLPADSVEAHTLNLERTGDTLFGQYTEIPSEDLALTVQLREPWFYQPLVTLSLFPPYLIAMLLALLSWKMGRNRGRKLHLQAQGGSRGYLLSFQSILLSIGFAITFLVLSLICLYGPDAISYFYGNLSERHYKFQDMSAMLIFGVSFLIPPISLTISTCTAFVVRRLGARD